MHIREIISIDRERGWALFFKRKYDEKRMTLNPEPREMARQEALAALDHAQSLANILLRRSDTGYLIPPGDWEALRLSLKAAAKATRRYMDIAGAD